MANERKERIKAFDKFYNTAKTVFDEFLLNDKRAKEFQSAFSFYVCPGSRNNEKNKRIVEIYFGQRIIDGTYNGKSWKADVEHGGGLLYQMDDRGRVIISLYPVVTENMKVKETCITLDIWLDPSKLTKSYLKKNWSALMAYMEYTNVDGEPTISQKIKVWYLRTFKKMVIKNEDQPTRFSKFLRCAFNIVIGVCFSGATLIFFINKLSKSSTETENQVKEINSGLEKKSTQLKEVAKDTVESKHVETSSDSLIKKKAVIQQTNKKIKKD